MIGLPPFDAGGVHETVAWALPATAVGLRTTPGRSAGVLKVPTVAAGLVPTALVAVMVAV